jgi:hypothetical protein
MWAVARIHDACRLGRIVNRFSKDQNTVDEALPRAFQSYTRQLAVVLGIFLVISYSTPIFLAIIAPLGPTHPSHILLCTKRHRDTETYTTLSHTYVETHRQSHSYTHTRACTHMLLLTLGAVLEMHLRRRLLFRAAVLCRHGTRDSPT